MLSTQDVSIPGKLQVSLSNGVRRKSHESFGTICSEFKTHQNKLHIYITSFGPIRESWPA